MQDPLAFVFAIAQLAAAIAVLNGCTVGIGQGNLVASAIQAMARQPEQAGSIRTTMIIGLAMSETSAIYGLFIAILMLFANPMVASYLSLTGR